MLRNPGKPGFSWGGSRPSSRRSLASNSSVRASGLSWRAALVLAVLAATLAPAHAQLRGHGGPVRALAVSADGQTAVSGSFDETVIRWSLARDAAEQVMRFHDGSVKRGGDPRRRPHRDCGERTAASRCGSRAPIGRPRSSPATRRRWSRSRPRPTVRCSPPRRGTHTVRLWPLAGGTPRVLEGHTQNVNGVAFTPDGRALVSAGYDLTLRVWPLAGGAPDDHDPCRRRSTASWWRRTARSSPAAPTARSISCRRRASCAARSRPPRPRSSRSRSRATARSRRRGEHSRLGRDHRARRPACRAHAGRSRSAGVVGDVPARQSHAAHRRRRPRDPSLGRLDRRSHRLGRARRRRGYACALRGATTAPRCFAPASRATRSMPATATAPADPRRHLRPPYRDAAGLPVSEALKRLDIVWTPRRSPSCSRSGR